MTVEDGKDNEKMKKIFEEGKRMKSFADQVKKYYLCIWNIYLGTKYD